MTERGTLVDSKPDGQDVRSISGPNQFQLTDIPSVSPDGKSVIFTDGRVWALGDGPPTLGAALPLGPNQVLPAGRAFSARGSDVVVLTEGEYQDQSTTFGVSVVDTRSRASSSLGNGSHVAGDPKVPGAFVAVPAPPVAVSGVMNPATPDAELDLRDADRPSLELASAASIRSDIGLDPSTPVALFPIPNPSGALVAVEVANLLERNGANAGLVVLDRQGGAVAIETPGLGPSSDALATWSPDGSALVYSSEAPGGPVIDVWTVGGSLENRPVPPDAGGARCLWSPDGRAVLCSSTRERSGNIENSWNLADAGNDGSADLPGPGIPVDWFGASR